MSEPVKARHSIASVDASMSPADKAIAAPGVPCFLLVRSKRPGSRRPCAICISTRAAAVVQASTQANMLISAPKSIATPSGAMPAISARWCSGLVDSLSFPVCGGLWGPLSEGAPLSRAMEAYPNVFDSSTVNLIRAGEATGSLNDTLARLIEMLTEQRELRTALLTALAYPLLIVAASFGVVLFFL